jgi:hypothetical protein
MDPTPRLHDLSGPSLQKYDVGIRPTVTVIGRALSRTVGWGLVTQRRHGGYARMTAKRRACEIAIAGLLLPGLDAGCVFVR